MSGALIILLHGVGSRGADLAPLGDHWQTVFPGLQTVSPDAPFPFDGGGHGRQWFSVAGVTEANRASRIATARLAFDQTIGRIVADQGFAKRLDRVVLVGFSQGSIMALDALVSGRWPVRAVVAFAGRLASPEPFAPASDSDVLVVHGDADPVMPVALSAQAEAALTRAGYRARRYIVPGAGHTITPPGVQAATQFLAQAIGS